MKLNIFGKSSGYFGFFSDICRKITNMGFYTDITKDDRIISYDFIETFIAQNVKDWSKWNVSIGTGQIESLFSQTIHSMPKKQFEFLLLHCGYIPDYYGHDSSQETLYSKLVESMVCEWAKRVGFDNSFLQTQKSNKEDVTIKKGNKIIVCDAKSFRLGRSQAAPNPKDTIKKEAYNTWLDAYNSTERVGGLTTFPSKHNWKKGGVAYEYYTGGNPPIMLLFYEHLAFILNQGIKADKIINVLNSYSQIFPHADKSITYYWDRIIKALFDNNSNYTDFWSESRIYISEKVNHSADNIKKRLRNIEKGIDEKLNSVSKEELYRIAKEALLANHTTELLHEQLKNIIKFRMNE